MNGFDAFAEALTKESDVVIPLRERGALSMSEALALRGWFDQRQAALRAERSAASAASAAERPEECSSACSPPVHRLPCPTAYAIQEAEWETR